MTQEKSYAKLLDTVKEAGDDIQTMTAFASLVAAAEREACAKLADEYATWGGSNFFIWFKKLSAAIRARGETK
jgi:hypothetical protein